MKTLSPPPFTRNQGFTLAEIMVVVLIVGATLVTSVLSLTNSMGQAAHTRDIKIARELGLLKLGQFSSALYSEDIEDHMAGDFSEQDYEQFQWEVVLGDEAFDEAEEDGKGNFNNWDTSDQDDEDEPTEKPYQEVRVKVTFPGPKESHNEIILEKRVTWSFLYGEGEETDGGI